ncbi:PP2C family protein-serine/threonine phosphatase [Arthrobacter cryoconiti]|uniref:PP2C family protein-serine/threonine phosphatase n=1 Tax=Arthrobacter cryoconiti TaxID=748907 RepID=A0ABV8R1M6_9MICC|nr:PP2C family serine/threonine-protein phosphatase [Arthrobacter cryoconiti]MCC9067753.1 protein phosphatase 2C domain-containing protein [Arthrobacter cryoconiti]
MAETTLILRYAARSHVGLVRAKNDDSAYAGRYLAVVADGMGGHAGGDVASASTVLDLIHLDHGNYTDDAGTHLADEIQSANSLLSELVHVNPKLAGMGTTVTSLLLSGQRLAYAHIGDSRAYRLKNNTFEQMSNDHTFVQHMIDEGRMTEAEAEVHPHKNVLMRVLGDVDASPELDLKYFDAEPGERWLLCSDGLNFVRHEMIEEVIRHTKSLAAAADTLIELTLAAGSPDNVTVVIFDVVEASPDDTQTAALETITPSAKSRTSEVLEDDAPVVADPSDSTQAGPLDEPKVLKDDVGAAAIASPTANQPEPKNEDIPEEELDTHIRASAVHHELSLRPHELVGAAVTANAEGKIPRLEHRPPTQRAATVLTHKPVDTPVISDETEESLPRAHYRRLVLLILGILATLAIVAGGWLAYTWTQAQYFVGLSNGNVAIYQGVSQNLGPISLSHLLRETSVSVSSLPEYSQQLVTATMPASTLGTAEQLISDLQLGTGSSLPPCNLLPTSSATGTSSAATGGTIPATAQPSTPGNSPAATATPISTAPPTCSPGGGN